MKNKSPVPSVNAQILKKQMSRKKSMKRQVSGKRRMSKFEPNKDECNRNVTSQVSAYQEPDDVLRFPSIKMNRFKS